MAASNNHYAFNFPVHRRRRDEIMAMGVATDRSVSGSLNDCRFTTSMRVKIMQVTELNMATSTLRRIFLPGIRSKRHPLTTDQQALNNLMPEQSIAPHSRQVLITKCTALRMHACGSVSGCPSDLPPRWASTAAEPTGIGITACGRDEERTSRRNV